MIVAFVQIYARRSQFKRDPISGSFRIKVQERKRERERERVMQLNALEMDPQGAYVNNRVIVINSIRA